jgi:hypothetical protein
MLFNHADILKVNFVLKRLYCSGKKTNSTPIYIPRGSDSSRGTDIPPSRDVHTLEATLERLKKYALYLDIRHQL